MRPISRRLFRILNNEQFEPIELIELRPTGSSTGSIIRLTGAGEQVTWNSNTYYPINLGRGLVEEIMATDSGQTPAISITVTNVDGQMAALLNRTELEGAKVTVYLVDRKLLANPRDAITLTDGELRDPQLTEATLTFSIDTVLAWKEKLRIPKRLWQKACNYTFGSRPCGVDLSESPFTLDAVLEPGSTDEYLVVPESLLVAAGSPLDPTDFWAAGYVVMMSGDAALQCRPIHRVQTIGGEHRFFLRYPLLTAPAAGDAVRVRRGCRKTKADCVQRQGDALNFGGFAEVPYGLIVPKFVNRF